MPTAPFVIPIEKSYTLCQKRILLIVDDDEAVLRVLKGYLKLLLPDYQVIGLKDGLAALAEVHEHPVDLILTDYEMPRLNGLDLAAAVHQIAPHLPVILVTGGYDYEDIQTMAGSAGLAGFLAKPFSMRQLKELLQANGIIAS